MYYLAVTFSDIFGFDFNSALQKAWDFWKPSLQDLVYWVLTILLNFGSTLVKLMTDSIPKAYLPTISTVASHLQLADSLVPVVHALTMLAAYLVFVLMFVVGKITVHLLRG